MKNLEDLIKKLHEGTLSGSEFEYLLRFLKEKEPVPEMQSMFEKIWEKSDEFTKEIDTTWIFKQISDKVNRKSDNYQNDKIRPTDGLFGSVNFRKIIITGLKYAAVFLLAFILFRVFSPVPESEKPFSSENQFQKIIVPYGSKSTVELPDGSVIILNSGSSLSYSSDEFNSSRRSVILEGEGFFTVEKDPERSFYVNTHGMKLKVIGTTFNVKAYPDENTEEATLLTGSLEIYTSDAAKSSGRPILLKPNEKAVFNKLDQAILKKKPAQGQQTIEPVELKSIELQDNDKTEQAISWKDNQLIFNNEIFSNLVVKIERWYAVDITVNYPELNNARFTGRFDKETVEQVMNALSTITPFKFEIMKNQITIMKY